MKNLAAITGLEPFNLNRISFIFAFSAAALVISKLVDAYLFCGFNKNFFVDLPLGVVVFVSYCFMPLLGLAVNRKPTTNRGRCCRVFAMVLISTWLFVTYGGIITVILLVYGMGSNDEAGYDPLNVCGSRTYGNVRAQFSNAMATFDIFQRIDLTYKIAVALGWFVLALFGDFAFVLSLVSCGDTPQHHQALETPVAPGKAEEENGDTIIWMQERAEGKTEQSSALAARGSIDIEDETPLSDAARDAEDRKSEVGSTDVRIENLRNEIYEPGNNAEPQLKEAKEPEFSIVSEEEAEATTTKAAREDSK